MIKKAQIKFISIVMCILFIVFLFIFGTITVIMNNVNSRAIEQSIDSTAESVLLTGINDKFIHHKSVICTIKPSPLDSEPEYEIWFDENTFTLESSQKIVKTAFENKYHSGRINNIYYKVYTLNSGPLLVALDATDIRIAANNNLIKLVMIFSAILFVLFIVVSSLSFYVFKPIKDSFTKQKQFISNASHELKTPLAVISANADVIKQDYNSQWVDNIRSQTSRMNVLVEDMLTLAKMDEGRIRLKPEKFILSEEILMCTLPFDAIAYEKGKKFIVNVQPNIVFTGDKASVVQIVNILLDNAFKHASENGEIIVDLHKEKSRILLSVSNTGSKVPAEQANKVFERFYRGDSSRNRETGGSGLGLSIAKSVADANKWKISAQSILNESMSITVIF